MNKYPIMYNNVPDTVRQAIELYGDILPILKEMKNCEQDHRYHAEGNVEIHTNMVLSWINKFIDNEAKHLPDSKKTILKFAALLHDISKSTVSRVVEKNGEFYIRTPRHEATGFEYLATKLHIIIPDIEMCREILHLVLFHQPPKHLVIKNECEAKWRNLARYVDMELMYWLELADMRGREADDYDNNIMYMELFKVGCEEYNLFNSNPFSELKIRLHESFMNKSFKWLTKAYHNSINSLLDGSCNSIEECIAKAYNIPNEFPEFIMLCGPSGSGKSRYLSKLPNATVINMDNIRLELTGDVSDQSENGTVQQMAKERLKEALRTPGLVVWDNTSLRSELRAKQLQLARDYGASTKIIVFQLTEAELYSNNKNRSNPVPEHILVKQLESFQFPLPNEADIVEVVNNKCDIIRIEGLI